MWSPASGVLVMLNLLQFLEHSMHFHFFFLSSGCRFNLSLHSPLVILQDLIQIPFLQCSLLDHGLPIPPSFMVNHYLYCVSIVPCTQCYGSYWSVLMICLVSDSLNNHYVPWGQGSGLSHFYIPSTRLVPARSSCSLDACRWEGGKEGGTEGRREGRWEGRGKLS